MITIGMNMNGYTIVAAVQQFRKDEREGVVILGVRTDDRMTGYAIATVPESEVTSDRPARHWDTGHYTYDGDDAVRRFKYFANL